MQRKIIPDVVRSQTLCCLAPMCRCAMIRAASRTVVLGARQQSVWLRTTSGMIFRCMGHLLVRAR